MQTPTQAPAAERTRRTGRWTWLSKPLFTACIFGCVVSLLESRNLTLGRVLPAAIIWTWVPILEILALGAVWRMGPRKLAFPEAVDRFCAGDTPWWLLLIAFATFWREMSETVWLCIAAAIACWTALSDYRLFRYSLGSTAPLRDLLLERALAWVPGILLFGGAALVPGVVERLK